MAGRYLPTELQDASGDVIYPHSEADIIFMSDGSNVEEAINTDTTEEDIRGIFNK